MPVLTEPLTADLLLTLPKPASGKHYELSDGELILVGNAGALHELTKTRIFEILTEYRIQRKAAGRAFAETQFTLRADRARIPDLAWVSQSKLDQIPRENRAISVAPDLAVEIISDSEQPEAIEQKLRDYLEAGVEVWQVFPSLGTITVWQGNQGQRLSGEQTLSSPCLPGFEIAVAEFFRL